MKTHHILTTAIFLFIVTFSALAAELSQGPAITADDLAKQLNIFSASINYKQDTPFSKLTVGLIYKEKDANGTYVEKKELLYTQYDLRKKTTEQTIKVLVDSNASTIIVDSWSSRGKGIQFSTPFSTLNPPDKMADGSFALVTFFKDSKNSEPDIKGVLTLIVTPNN